MINPMALTGKHILVTGASSGIGRAVSIHAAALGASVSLVARNEERLLDTRNSMDGDKHQIYSADLTDAQCLEDMLTQCVQRNGLLDGVIHCAGWGVNRPVSMIKHELLDQMMRINVYAFADLLRLGGKKKYSNNNASILAVSSVAAIQGDKTQGAYAASKAALNGLIHPAAKELAPRGIRVNGVALGMIATEMYERLIAEENVTQQSLARQYLGIGTLEDASNAICFLVSPASRFITGTVLVADGGYLS